MNYWPQLLLTFLIGLIVQTIVLTCFTLIDMLLLALKFVVWPFVGLYIWCERAIGLWDELRHAAKQE